MRPTTQQLTIYTALGLVVVLLGVIFYLQFRPDEPAPAATGTLELAGQPSLGEDDAPVKLVLFEDFKCPACRNFDENVFPRLVRDYVAGGQVEAFFVNFPFLGPDSTTAALAGECAYWQNEAAFWEFKTYVFRSQGPESSTWATPERLAEIAREYVPALDAEALHECIEQERTAEAVESDLRMRQALGVNSTPSVFVNGQRVAQPSYQAIRAAIEAALPEG